MDEEISVALADRMGEEYNIDENERIEFSRDVEKEIIKEALGWLKNFDLDTWRDVSPNKWEAEIKNFFEQRYDMDKEIQMKLEKELLGRMEYGIRADMKRELRIREEEKLFDGLGPEDRAALDKEIIESKYSHIAENKRIRDTYRLKKKLESEGTWMEVKSGLKLKENRLEKNVNEKYERERKEIAQKFRERIKEREKIRGQNKLEKGISPNEKLKEVKKEIKPN